MGSKTAAFVMGLLIMGLFCMPFGAAQSCNTLVPKCQDAVLKGTPPSADCCTAAKQFSGAALCDCARGYPSKYYPAARSVGSKCGISVPC